MSVVVKMVVILKIMFDVVNLTPEDQLVSLRVLKCDFSQWKKSSLLNLALGRNYAKWKFLVRSTLAVL